QPVLSVTDEIQQGTTLVVRNMQASFDNCIFWGGNGSVTNEVVVSQQTSASFSVNFSNCLWKVQSAPTGVTSTAIIANEDPLFDSVNNSTLYYDFHLQPGSPALGAGMAAGIPIDLDGNPRPPTNPDLGCYQRQ
ncbi:MAG TPA: choice-of-anchor Q domain-containing protein, partial [Puia sp.]|nr:choice-of-anchor Q domain-containing protein [Puia sp.]